MNDDEALRAAAVNAVNVLVDGVAATMRKLLLLFYFNCNNRYIYSPLLS